VLTVIDTYQLTRNLLMHMMVTRFSMWKERVNFDVLILFHLMISCILEMTDITHILLDTWR